MPFNAERNIAIKIRRQIYSCDKKGIWERRDLQLSSLASELDRSMWLPLAPADKHSVKMTHPWLVKTYWVSYGALNLIHKVSSAITQVTSILHIHTFKMCFIIIFLPTRRPEVHSSCLRCSYRMKIQYSNYGEVLGDRSTIHIR
jgi:hypothetical protein